MGCACGKNRKAGTAYATRKAAKPQPSGPVRVQFTDDEIREYDTRLEAHAAIMLAGGGKILPDEK